MKIVRFSNGEYGVRRGWLLYEYLGLDSTEPFWWRKGDKYFRYCMGYLKDAEKRYSLFHITEEVV